MSVGGWEEERARVMGLAGMIVGESVLGSREAILSRLYELVMDGFSENMSFYCLESLRSWLSEASMAVDQSRSSSDILPPISLPSLFYTYRASSTTKTVRLVDIMLSSLSHSLVITFNTAGSGSAHRLC